MGDSGSIQKYDFSIKINFSAEYFFKDILITCHERKLLDDEILTKISYERLETLKMQLKYYTKDESSSVMVETAEKLMQGIDYTIGMYLKTFDNIELIIDRLKNTSLFDMLKKGHDLIKEKVAYSEKLLEKIQKNKLDVDNYSYNDTIDYGISIFFKEYNDFFEPHEVSGSVDYQLCMDNMNYKGIEYTSNYLETLNLENEFCYKFDIVEINKLLKGYDKKSELLLINIFELILINSLGLIACGKVPNNLNISSTDREYIKRSLEKLSLNELQEVLIKYGDSCCEILNIENDVLINYIRKAVVKITPAIYDSFKLNKLETVFISTDKNKNDEVIRYIDGKQLSNYAFRKLSEKIRDSSSTQDKLLLIKNNIKSLGDLTDMLNAECLFEDEFITYFKGLSKLEIILLARHISDSSMDNEYDKEWYLEFKKYISSLTEDEQMRIDELKEKIELI